MHKMIFIATLLVQAFSISAQTSKQAELNTTIDSLLNTHFRANEPGIAVLIAHKGKVLYQKAFGSANVELGVSMKPDMVFRIGSITKQFTAIGILQLMEQGRLKLNDSIQQYIPYPSKGHTITIEHLLTHTSGIPDYSDADTTHNPYIERHDFTPQQLISYFDYMPLDFKPGTKYKYSNSGYVLLAFIIQKISGISYHQFIKNNIIDRIGLKQTLFAREKTIVPGRVAGYTRDNGYFENREYQSASIAFGAGDLLSTTGDLWKWNQALIGGKLVKEETLRKAFTPYRLENRSFTSYGYGWIIDSFDTKRIHHEGQVSGFTALASWYPAQEIYVCILTNQLSGEDKTNFTDDRFRLFDKIFSLAVGKSLVHEIAIGEDMLTKYTGTYSATFSKNQKLTIRRSGDKLYMDLSNGTGKNMWLQPLSETVFALPDIKQAQTTCTFVVENGNVTKLIFTQDKKYEWEKIL